MKFTFEVTVVLDSEQIARQGQRVGLSMERAIETALADVEGRLFDGIRHMDSVSRVGVTLVGGYRPASNAEMSGIAPVANPTSEAVQ